MCCFHGINIIVVFLRNDFCSEGVVGREELTYNLKYYYSVLSSKQSISLFLGQATPNGRSQGNHCLFPFSPNAYDSMKILPAFAVPCPSQTRFEKTKRSQNTPMHNHSATTSV